MLKSLIFLTVRGVPKQSCLHILHIAFFKFTYNMPLDQNYAEDENYKSQLDFFIQKQPLNIHYNWRFCKSVSCELDKICDLKNTLTEKNLTMTEYHFIRE